MGIFRQLHKSAFWSQLLLGMLAVLSLPEAQASSNPAQLNTIQQSYQLSQFVTTQAVEQQQIQLLIAILPTQQFARDAVTFCKIFAFLPPLQASSPPPIRAGPII